MPGSLGPLHMAQSTIAANSGNAAGNLGAWDCSPAVGEGVEGLVPLVLGWGTGLMDLSVCAKGEPEGGGGVCAHQRKQHKYLIQGMAGQACSMHGCGIHGWMAAQCSVSSALVLI